MNRKILFLTSIIVIILCFELNAQNSVTVRKVEFAGNLSAPSAEIKKGWELKKGRIFNKQKLAESVDKYERYLNDLGYLFMRIDSVQTVYEKDSTAVLLRIYGDEGKRVVWGNIEVKSDSVSADLYRRQLNVTENSNYSRSGLEKDLKRLLSVAADSGFLFAEVDFQNMQFRPEDNNYYLDINIKINENERASIQNILVKGNHYTRDHVILRELNVSNGDVYSDRRIKQIPEKLTRLSFFKNVKKPAIIMNGEKDIDLVIEVEEGNATYFDGVVGYIPGDNTVANPDGYFTGLVDLNFKNLFGTGRQFDIHWKKADQYSEEFSLAYTEPWILGYPLDLGLGLDRVVRDSTYVEWNYSLNARLKIFDNLSLVSLLEQKTVTPDSAASRDLRLAKNSVLNMEIGVEYDTRDYQINPRSGIFYNSSYSYGVKNNLGPDYLLDEDNISKSEELQTIKLKFEWFYNFYKNQVFSVSMNANQIKGDRLQLSDYFWFGGARSLRGYRENQFRGDIIAWSNIEYRFILNRNSRIFLFSDWGYYQYTENDRVVDDTLPGYGLGIRMDTPMGILGVDFGLGRGDSFSEGKIHFGIINRF
ncbi:MAG: outer membrane protein assembly factor [Calditrichaceae bacterium]